MVTMKPRFIHKKKKIDLSFYSELIPKSKVSFGNSCEDYRSLVNWMDIRNVILIEADILTQDMYWSDEICCWKKRFY